MRLALAIASFVVLLVHGLVFYQQFFHKWENYQTAYFDQARSMAKTDAEKAALAARSPRVEQLLVTKFGDMRVDRCSTCHMAMDDPRFDKHAQPLRTHPYSEALGDRQVNGKWERRHKFADFGCTVCHEGQGRGLQEEFSHGHDEYWPEPLAGYIVQENWRKEYQPKLKGKDYMQANCAQCHTEKGFSGTPMVEKGRQLFFSSNCYGCHRIEGMSDGTLGPDLSEVGKKFRVDYIWESIVDPRANLATSFMPKFHINEDEVRALVIFLKSRRGMNFAETGLQRYRAAIELKQPAGGTGAAMPTGAALLAQGEKSIADRACTACHKLGDKDGGIAPDLSYEGLVKSEQWIYEHFKSPATMTPDSIMPAFRIPDEEFRAMAAYLASRKTPLASASGADTYKALCQRCHGEKGDGHGPVAIYLDPYPRDLTKAGFINSKSTERLTNSIKSGVAGTSMPAWGQVLKEEQVQGVLQYVFATFTKEPRRELKPLKAPDQNPVASSADSVGRGEKTFVQRCSGCHGRKADGKGPNSLDILPRPRNLRNSYFVNSVTDRRLFESILYGVQGTAMPPWIDYGLSQQDVGDLVNFIRSFNPKPVLKSEASRSDNARGN
ncbi:MAG: c-type cytochrome [Acidobacteria bacterium]|nr:c-type cytochrome [Acidobacteriota bacterium]